MQNFTRNLHMFLGIKELWNQLKKLNMDKTDYWNEVSDFFKWLYLASDYFEKNWAKEYQKQQIVNILWRILRPKLTILLHNWDHISIVSLLQSFIAALTTRLSTVC